MALLPSNEPSPCHILLPLHDQSLAQDHWWGKPLEKLGELAAPEVQLLMLAAQRENGSATTSRASSFTEPVWRASDWDFAASATNPWPVHRKPMTGLQDSLMGLIIN